jgi:hypothetical protein
MAEAAAADKLATEPVPTMVQALDRPMGWLGVILLTVYFLTLSSASVYSLVRIWPTTPDTTSTAPATATEAQGGSTSTSPCQSPTCPDQVTLFGGTVQLDFTGREDRRLILIALLAGGIGAFASSAISMGTFLGNRQLWRSWTLWYLFRPPVGMALGLLFYFLLRGGLISVDNTDVVNPYGVAAVAGIVGMFVKEATDKMQRIAEAIFSGENQKRPRADPLKLPKDKAVIPDAGEHGQATGQGLASWDETNPRQERMDQD